jgi:hypothetical protein
MDRLLMDVDGDCKGSPEDEETERRRVKAS